MKKVKQFRNWKICELNKKEIMEYGFTHAVIHPDNAEYLYLCTPADTDMECNSLEEAIDWIKNY